MKMINNIETKVEIIAPVIVNSNFKGAGCHANFAVAFLIPVSVGDHWDDFIQRRLVHNSARKHLASDSFDDPLMTDPKRAD